MASQYHSQTEARERGWRPRRSRLRGYNFILWVMGKQGSEAGDRVTGVKKGAVA